MTKYLYYNLMEVPAEIHIISKSLGVDMDYEPSDVSREWPAVWMHDLYDLAKLDCFDDVLIRATKHLNPYVKEGKKNKEGETVEGWISLKEYKNGGGYLDDKYLRILDGKNE